MNPLPLLDNGDEIIQAALKVLEARLRYTTEHESFASPNDARAFCVLRLAQREHEVFAALWLDNRHRLLAYEELFRGTIDGCSVHPREVVKSALQHNAAAAIFCHFVARHKMRVMCPGFLCALWRRRRRRPRFIASYRDT